MESHPTIAELMARPARERRERLWNTIAYTLLALSVVAFGYAWVRIIPPSWTWWGFLFIPWLVIVVVILRRLERWWWSHSPWAWRRI